ncbi:hypothetical protein BKA70DRAFT_1432322 [Coprinopsis sp. MPI-PUGE-AT-0042]|nr:hypothetical protein BKA70DRAFT_1432322 [Coprinopsis sp. MPI-PUGE-AT-0042]
MLNHEGTNQWGEKNYPSDQDLEAFLRIYAERGLMIHEKLSCLKKDLNFSIGKSKLNEYERQFKIPTVRRPYMSQEEIDGEIASMVARDTAQGSGPVTIKSMLKNKETMSVKSCTLLHLKDLTSAFLEGTRRYWNKFHWLPLGGDTVVIVHKVPAIATNFVDNLAATAAKYIVHNALQKPLPTRA